MNDTQLKMAQHKQQNKPKHNWNLYGVIILDSGSTTKVTVMDPELVTNIKPKNNTLHMPTNVGTK